MRLARAERVLPMHPVHKKRGSPYQPRLQVAWVTSLKRLEETLDLLDD